MRIAFVANTAWSMYNFRKNILNYWLAQGYQITVIAPFDDKTSLLEKMGCICINIDIQRQGTNPYADAKLLYSLYYIYKEIKPNFIFHYTIKPNIYGSIAAKLAGVSNNVAITTGLGSAFIKNNWITKIAKFLYKRSLCYTKYVYFLNQDDLNKFIQYKIIPIEKAKLLPSEGVDTDFFSLSAIDIDINNLNIPNNAKNQTKFLLIARMLKDKGIVEYAESAKILKKKYGNNIEFNLLGAIDAQNPNAIPISQIKSWQAQGIINYLGTANDVRIYINESDCVVLPSYLEGIPRTLLEGASMQKPLIASDVSGCKDVVKHNHNGYLCKPKSVDDLVFYLDKFINLDHDSRYNMGINGRNYVRDNFSDDKVIKEYISILNEA